ncbi:MAG: MBL fold metallo-hydrolase [Lentisphaeria bacterium]|nr:MBL fold metallo-hydrolase [Lentisphaeria bacterium]
MLNIKTISVGVLEVSCYLVWEPESGEGLVIDPGDDAAAVIEAIRADGVKPAAVFLTHAHVDHIRGVPGIVNHFNIPVILHAGDHGLYHSPNNALLPWIPAAEKLPEPGEMPAFSHLPAPRIIHTPGHTQGGVCLYFPTENILFTGDTLFAGSIGRTDFPGGDAEQLIQSIHIQLLTLPDSTIVYPGHGLSTTIGDEKAANPFI